MKYLNILFVTTQGAYLHKDGEALAIRVDNETRHKLPAHTLDGVICFGQVSMSPALMGHLAEKDVCVSFLSENGRFLARVAGPTHGNVLLRRRHYRLADDATASADMARAIVTGKLYNCRTSLRRSAWEHPGRPGSAVLTAAADRLGGIPAGSTWTPCAARKGKRRRPISRPFRRCCCAANRNCAFRGATAGRRSIR